MISKLNSSRSIIVRTAHKDAMVSRSAARPRNTWARYAMSCACLTLVIAMCGATTSIKAQSNQAPAAYDKLLDEAVSAFDANDFSRAHGLFRKAYEVRPNARVLRGLGIAALRLERYSEAYRTLSLSLKHPVQSLTQGQSEEVTGLLSWMETSLGCVRLRWSPAEPAEFQLTVDDGVVNESTLWLSPGTHHVAVRAPGYAKVDRTITLAPEQHEVIDVAQSKREISKAVAKPAVRPEDAAHSLPVRQEASAPAAATSPREVERQSGMRRDTSTDGGSVLTSWWFWTAVAVVAAGGVTTAVLLSTSGGTRPLDTAGSPEVVLP